LKDSIPHWQSELQQQREEQLQQEEMQELSPFTKRILVVDDDPDVTFTFKAAFKEANRISGGAGGERTLFHVNAYNDSLVALSEFRPNFL
jgi:hypothetical protein